MPQEVTIHMDGDGAMPEMAQAVKDGNVIVDEDINKLTFARLPGGMTSGRSSMAIAIELKDGRFVYCELSMRNFLLAAEAFTAAEKRDV